MNKIFAVVIDARVNTEPYFHIQSCRTLREAESYLQETSEQYRKDAMDDGWVIESDSPGSFEAYEEGFECENHYYITIHELTA